MAHWERQKNYFKGFEVNVQDDLFIKSSVVAKLIYGSITWWHFDSATDRQKLSIHAKFYSLDPNYNSEEQCNETNHRLFNKIFKSPDHVLEQL